MLTPPSPEATTHATFEKALKLYPWIVEKVYASKLKNDTKKVADALQRDTWRFENLPLYVALRATEGRGLTKDEVEKLVIWKITHGHSRPFLPGMVRKNDASTVEKQTSLAFSTLSTITSPSTTTLSKALDHACKLTGIGPATGTLILSIFDPVHIPFFQDEMFEWFFPGSGKLKYTAKEYVQLFEAVGPMLRRLGVKAVELEMVAYVLGHIELLDDEKREGLEGSFKASEKAVAKEEDVPKREDDEGAVDALQQESTLPKGRKDVEPKKGTAGTKGANTRKEPPVLKGRKRAVKDDKEDDPSELQAPKRRSQRKR